MTLNHLSGELSTSLLGGDGAILARQSAEQVGEVLSEASRSRSSDPSLADGRIGTSIVLANLARMLERADWFDAARADMAYAVQGLSEYRLRTGLFPGFAGIAWSIAHLEREFFPDEEFDYDEIDSALLQCLTMDGPRHYDLISGWVGLGVYALERWPHARAQELLHGVVSRLHRGSEVAKDGITWKTDPALLPPHQLKGAPRGYYNLGLAHGVPGVVSLLAQAHRVGALDANGQELLRGAVQWLQGQRKLDSAGMRYSSWLTDAERNESGSRLGWCYGDLGVAASLVVAGACCDQADWLDDGVSLAKRAVSVDEKYQGVRDHGLCHGYAGVAHVLHRLWRLTGDAELAPLARDWLQLTLDRRHNDVGIAGYATWRATNADRVPESEWEYGYIEDAGYLTGAGGVGLALASALVTDFPGWDRPLLLSVPKAG